MSKLVFNISKLHAFRDSSYCPVALKELADQQLFDSITQDLELRNKYDMFCYFRWANELSRRRIQARSGTIVPTLEDKLRMKQEVEVMLTLKQNINKPKSYNSIKPTYIHLFDDNINNNDWTRLEIAIRLQFLQELEELKKQGGCSNCKRNALVRKYILKLKELLTD